MSAQQLKIFVLEDDEWYNNYLVHSISLNPDYEVTGFTDVNEFMKALTRKPDVVTLDFRLGRITGDKVLENILAFNDTIPVIVISEQENIETAVELIKKGARDYLVKSKDMRNRILHTINIIAKEIALIDRIDSLQKEIERKYDFQQSIIGNSDAIRQIFSLLEKATQTNIPVSVYGETGTGKELVAKAIHFNSKRKNKPFVPVNVAAIPSELIESELFGHEKGAFTGANARRTGKFEEAHGGTLFLDEIGEMPFALQSKLLRAIQEREVVRIGSNTPVPTDCRIIVATQKNLLDEVRKASFREDLYYRLLGLPIELPPLRNRDKDVLILAKYFIEKFCEDNAIPLKQMDHQAQKKLLGYAWPGNVRELKSVIELATVLSNDSNITVNDIRLSSEDILSQITDQEVSMRVYTHKILDMYLKKFSNDIPLVAQKLDISPATIYRMIKEMKEGTV